MTINDTRRSRIQALVRPNREPIKAEVPATGGDRNTATIRLYDPIDSWGEWWGVSAKEFATVIDGLPDMVSTIRLLMNCLGGEVFEGIAIKNLLAQHPARIEVVVEGVAASMGSFIACAADELVMAPNSELMIHDPWGAVVGDAQDMRDMAEDLDRLADNIASVYQAKAGGDIAQWRAAMARESWYSAEEAVAAGLADRVDEKADDASEAKARVDLTIFNHAGRAKAPAPTTSPTPASNGPVKGQEGGSTVDLTEIRQALDLPDDTSDEDVLTGVLDKLTAPPAPPEPTEAKLPDGVVAIDAAQLDELKAQAKQGVEARAEQQRQHRETLVSTAVADGRIPPARKDAWVAQLEADPGAETVLAGLAKGTIPVSEIGAAGAADLDSDDSFYNEIFKQEVAS